MPFNKIRLEDGAWDGCCHGLALSVMENVEDRIVAIIMVLDSFHIHSIGCLQQISKLYQQLFRPLFAVTAADGNEACS